MIIKVEPKDWNMYSVDLLFNQETPDSEDGAIEDYLAEHGLVPKRQSQIRLEGSDWQVISFGGCYLGRHLSSLSQIQRQAVEREMLAAEIPRVLRSGPNGEARLRASSLGDAPLRMAVATLVEEYHTESSFDSDGDGLLEVTLDAVAVQDSFLEIVGAMPDQRESQRTPAR